MAPQDPNQPVKVIDEEANTRLEDQIRLQEEANKAAKERLEVLKKILALEDEITLTSQTNINQLESEIKALETQITSGKTLLEREQAKLEITRKNEEIARNYLVIYTKQTEETKKNLDFVTEQVALGKATQQQLDEAKESYKENNGLLEITKNYLSELIEKNNELERSQEELLRIAREQYTVYMQIKHLGRDLDLAFQDQLRSVTGLNAMFKNLYFGMNPVLAVGKQLALEAISALGSYISLDQQFAASTGRIRSLTTQLGTLQQQSSIGVGREELNASMIGLYTTMSNFSNLQPQIQEQLATSAARMNYLGVSANVTGKNLDIMTKSFSMSAEKASKTQEEMARHAIAAGIAPSVMASDFANAMTTLAYHGDKAMDVFYRMEKQAKVLGVSITELNAIVGSTFDTFENSAKAAGKLNAILGGPFLSSSKLLNANEADRLVMLKEALAAAGKNIDTMGKYEQITLANALGIKNASELRKVLSADTNKLSAAQMSLAATEKELANIQDAAVPAQKKLQIALQQLLIVIQPFASALGYAINGFAWFFGTWVGKGVAAIAAIFYGVKALGSLKTVLQALEGLTTRSKIGIFIFLMGMALEALHNILLVPHSPILYFALMQLPPIIEAIGQAADRSKYGLMAMGLSMLMIGAGVYIAATGLAELVKAFKGLDAAQLSAVSTALGYFTLIFVSFIAAIAVLAYTGVGEIAILMMLGFGAAVLMLGGGIALAANGMAKLVESLTKIENIGELATGIYALSGAIYALMSSLLLSATGVGGVMMYIGMLALANSLKIIVDVINSIEGSKLTAFATFMSSFAEILKFSGIENTAKSIASAIKVIGDAIDKIPNEKSLSFASSMNSLGGTFSVIATLEESKLKSAKDFIQTAKEYHANQKESKSFSEDAVVNLLKQIASSTEARNQSTSTPQSSTIKIVMEGREVAKAIKPYMDDKISNIVKGRA